MEMPKNSPTNVKYTILRARSGKIQHLTEYFTGTACGASDKYEVAMSLPKLRALNFSCLSAGRWRINLLSPRSPSKKPTIFIVRVGRSLFAANLAIPEMQIFRCESRDNKLAKAAAPAAPRPTPMYTSWCTASFSARSTLFWPWQSSPMHWKASSCARLKSPKSNTSQ